MFAMTMREAMQALRFGTATPIRKLLRAGRLRGVQIGRRWRIDAESVSALLRGAQAPPADPADPRIPKPRRQWIQL
jgi:excisionase family DNA binding protein